MACLEQDYPSPSVTQSRDNTSDEGINSLCVVMVN